MTKDMAIEILQRELDSYEPEHALAQALRMAIEAMEHEPTEDKGMRKLEETNKLIDYIARLKESGLNVDNTVMLADIAKSLAMIADKLCGTESEEE